MTKNIFKILSVFVIGTVGGIFADQILWPYFIERPLFYKYRLEQTPIYVTEKNEITNYIQENIALKEAAEKVAKAVVGVKTKTGEAEENGVLTGSGLIVTNDGFLATLAELLPQGSDFSFYSEDKWLNYQVLKRDLKNNLALVRIDGSGFHTAGFASMEKIKMGERVFLVGFDFGTTTPRLMVNEGIIKTFNNDLIQTNILEKSGVNGSPLFNIEGSAVGLSFVNEDGRVSAIPIAKIRPFIGF